MRPIASRPTLLDVLALVAGTAIGLAPLAAAREFLLDPPLPSNPTQRARELLLRGQIGAAALLAGWSAAVVAIDLARPGRARGRARRRGPGVVACYAATAGGAGHLLSMIAQRGVALGTWRLEASEVAWLLFPISFYGGMVVGGAWLALLLARARRPDPGWVEGLGVALGAAWLAVLLLAQVRGAL